MHAGEDGTEFLGIGLIDRTDGTLELGRGIFDEVESVVASLGIESVAGADILELDGCTDIAGA